MKKYAALLLLYLILSAPAFARTSPRRHAPKPPSAIAMVRNFLLRAAGLEKADTPPPPAQPSPSSLDCGVGIDPTGGCKPKP